MSDPLGLLQRLAQAGFDFVIVGGYAGIVHGCTYVTQAIDVCCLFTAEKLLALQEVLSDLHPVHRMTPGRRSLEITAENAVSFSNLDLDTDLGRLDCLSTINGLGDYTQVKRLSERIDMDGTVFCVLTIDALIQAKKAMNRPRDREAIYQLEAIRELRRDNA